VRAAEAGLGIALVPELLCSAWFQSGALVPIFAVGLATSDAYFLVCRLKDMEKPEVAALMEWAVEEFILPSRERGSSIGEKLLVCQATPLPPMVTP